MAINYRIFDTTLNEYLSGKYPDLTKAKEAVRNIIEAGGGKEGELLVDQFANDQFLMRMK